MMENKYDRDTLISLFMGCVEVGKYEKALKVINYTLKVEKDEKYINLYLFYMYLLKKLVKLPDNLEQFFGYLTDDFFRLECFNEEDKINEIVNAIVNERYAYAVNRLNKLKIDDINIDALVVVLYKIIEKNKEVETVLERYLESKDYDAIISMTNGKNDERLSLINYLAIVLKMIESNLDYNLLSDFNNKYKACSPVELLSYYKNFDSALDYMEQNGYENGLYSIAKKMLESICDYKNGKKTVKFM